MPRMDVHAFHRHLLGIDANRTPEEFRLHDIHAALYNAYTNDGIHGYSNSAQNETLFTATLVLALCLTEIIHPVYLAVPKPHIKWVVHEQVERVGRHIFRCRKKEKEGALVLRQAFKQIRVTHEILRMEEPPRWVMFGFKSDDIIPEWAKGKLLEVGELAAPLNGASTQTA